MIEVRLRKLVMVDNDPRQILVLEEANKETPRHITLAIGPIEAAEICRILEQSTPPRPLTHQLLTRVVAQLGGKIEKAVINHRDGSTYFAELHLSRNGEMTSVDCRPSDALALCLRLDVPLYVSSEILNAPTEDD